MLTKEQFNSVTSPATNELYAVSGSGFGKPSGKYVDLSLGASGSTYTAPGNGWFYLNKTAGVANAYITFQNNGGSVIGTTLHAPGTGNACRGFIPVKKGDTVQLWYNATGTTSTFRFIYDEGE